MLMADPGGVAPANRLTARGVAYCAGVIAAGAAFVPVAWSVDHSWIQSWPTLLYIAAYTQIAALLPIRWSRGLQHVFTAPLVAAGLLAPGAGVAVVAWVALFDRRLPGRDAPLWRLVFVRASTALNHGVASAAAAAIVVPDPWTLPVRTLVYSLMVVCINLPLTAGLFAGLNHTSVIREIVENAGFSTVRSIVILGFAGGILFLILQQPVGYVMAPALGGLLLAVRANMADLQKQSQMRFQTLVLAGQALDARDSYTESHSTRVADFAARIASELRMSPREVEAVRSAGLLHDLGKIGIPDAILHKPTTLSAEERLVMERHASIGADMISRHEALAHLAPLVRHHHERWDGTGYPDGLTDEQIPLGARVLSVADSFDTMTGLRIYKPTRLTPEAAIEEIRRLGGRWYDPSVAAAAYRVVAKVQPRELIDPPTAEPPRRWGRTIWQLVAGMTISAFGDPLSTVALLVIVYQSTRSPLIVGATYVARAIATVVTTWSFGSIGDTFGRRRLILVVELSRALVVAVMPFLIPRVGVAAILVAVFVLAAGNTVVAPARQAIVGDSVDQTQVAQVLGVIGSATTLAQVLGFGVAGALLALRVPLAALFWIDAATFMVAGLTILGLGRLGGGAPGVRISAAVRTSWALVPARPYLLLAGAAGLAIGSSYPTLIVLAYSLARNGAQAYTMLEVSLAVGVAVGSAVAHRVIVGGGFRASLYGLVLMGSASIALGVSGYLIGAIAFMFVASVGSAIYLVANQQGLLRLAPAKHRSGVMATRFGVAQLAIIVGTAMGALVTATVGPGMTYAVLGVYLLLIGAIFHVVRLPGEAGVLADGAEPGLG